jgi:divalent metal cation (Fe/Co/Zn/Cd) transporter
MAESRQSPIASEPSSSISHVGAIERVQWFTIVWMSIEAGVSLFTAISARSVALAAFGADSAIELLSAATVLWRFRTGRQHAETTATKITGWLLVALVVYIATSSLYALILHRKAEASYLGMIVLIAAAFIMPWLGKQKRRLAADTNSAALEADATQSSVCAYLAWIALAGLLLNAFAHLWWADAVAALFLIPFVLKEAKEAFEGRTCPCG